MATHAAYKIIKQEDGTVIARTSVSWGRTFGRCNYQTFHRNGEIYTRGRLRAWGKKHGVEIPDAVAEQLPVKVWWE